jgi:pimeloyl-ACP methyl ester carboxylesterase
MARLFRVLTGLTLALVMLENVSGCGAGTAGPDDASPDSCARGSAVPYQPSIVPSRTAIDRMRIYLLHGLYDTYSLGLDQLAEKLNELSIPSTIIGWYERDIAPTIISDAYKGRPDGTAVVLMGHSYGADDAITLAEKLGEEGIPVELLFLFDATTPKPIPANVARCVHLMTPTLEGTLFPWIFAGNPVEAAEGNTATQVLNVPFTAEKFGAAELGCANHYSIDVNIAAHNLAIEEVLRCIDPESYPDPSASLAVPPLP